MDAAIIMGHHSAARRGETITSEVIEARGSLRDWATAQARSGGPRPPFFF